MLGAGVALGNGVVLGEGVKLGLTVGDILELGAGLAVVVPLGVKLGLTVGDALGLGWLLPFSCVSPSALQADSNRLTAPTKQMSGLRFMLFSIVLGYGFQ